MNIFGYFSKVSAIVGIISLLIPTICMPIQVKTNSAINLRDSSNNFERRLPTGTVVQIPDELIPKNVKKNEVHLLKWLKTVGDLKPFGKRRWIRGEFRKRKDFFAKIKIISIPGKKNRDLIGKSGNLAIRYLRRISTSLKMETTRETTFTPEKNKKQTDNFDCAEDCHSLDIKGQNFRKIYKPIMDALKSHKTMETVDKKVKETVKSKKGTCHKLEKEFNDNCSPMKYQQFVRDLYTKSKAKGIPPELLMGILIQESLTGKRNGAICNARGTEGSIGIFQIHYRSYNLKDSRCKEENGRRMPAPVCLKKPDVNLDHAISILRNKFKRVNGWWPKKNQTISNLTPKNRDQWRKALSAYNGGEGYVYQAYRDVIAFNKINGTNYDPQDWDARRLFMFRKHIDPEIKEFFRGRKRIYNRGYDNAITNVAYVESIFGRENSILSGHITQWQGFFDRDPKFQCKH